MATISQSAFDLIVAEEVSGKAYYIRHYQNPEWPGASSGITVGIGYDLAYATPAKIKADWGKHVSSDMLLVMMRCSGVKGTAAKALLPEVKKAISVPWDAALDVFANRDVPQWTATVCKAIKLADKLTPTCLGVIVSVAYNRGPSFSEAGDRFTEMRAIKTHVEHGALTMVPADLRGMKRLWPTLSGLRARRDHEADLWVKGLSTIGGEVIAKNVQPAPAVPDPDVPTIEGPARTKPPATTNTQNSTAGAVVVGGAVIASQGGFTMPIALLIFGGAVVVALVIWLVWWRNRNPK